MLRGFTDSTGVEWRVWEVFPSTGVNSTSADSLSRSSLKNTAYANGWLCFESANEKRRVAPIPRGWESLDPATLERLRDEAPVVPARRAWTSAHGTA